MVGTVGVEDLARIGIVDLMLGVPSNRDSWQETFGRLVKDRGSQDLRHPAGYMFSDLPEVDSGDYLGYLIAEMDRWGVSVGLLPVDFDDEWGCRGVTEHPDRLVGSYLVDPGLGVTGTRRLRAAVADLGAVAAACFPCGLEPQAAIDARVMYPLYATCCELELPIFVNVGVPGPRVPMHPQHADHIDAVCRDFPELVLVTRHGGEPWTATLIELMRRWPNLHYSTSAFAPKHYPPDIIQFANTEGVGQVLYAGYFPMALSLERLVTELAQVELTDRSRRRFVRDNALAVLRR